MFRGLLYAGKLFHGKLFGISEAEPVVPFKKSSGGGGGTRRRRPKRRPEEEELFLLEAQAKLNALLVDEDFLLNIA
jgi:hypothetical protein